MHMDAWLLQTLVSLFKWQCCQCLCCCRQKPEDIRPFWTHDSSDDTIVNSSVNEEYSNETFESVEATATATDNKKTSPPKTNKLSKGLGQGLSPRSLRSPKSPFSPANNRKGSESESEDSFSLTHSETASDQSDNEGRIRALTEELRRRKIEAERLKKEQKRRHKERMKAKEASLKKQIEAYEILILQVKSDLQKELEHEPVKPGIKPQIKQPRVSESKRLKKQQEVAAEGKLRTESESSKSSIDESKDTTGSPPSGLNTSSQVSPLSPASREDSLRQSLSPIKPDSLITTNKRTSLESISESTESPQASPSKTERKEIKSPSFSPEQADRARSPNKADSNISISEVIEESIVEELPDDTSLCEPVVKSARSLTFKLDQTSKILEHENKDAPVSTHSDKLHEELSAADVLSEVDDYSYSFSAASRTDDRTTPRAKSVNISKDVSFRDDVKSKNNKTSEPQENLPLSARSAKSITSEIITEDFESVSESEAAVSRSRPSDKLTRSYSREGEYTEDFSESSVSHSEKTLSKRSDRDASVDESIHTDEEISEALSVRSDNEDKHVELTFDLHAKLPQSEKNLPNLTPSAQFSETPASVTISQPLSDFSIGERVLVAGVQPCTLRFVGQTSFAPGIWVGVELDIPEGRNDGSKDGVKYFTCKPNYGLFAPPDRISRLPKDYSKDETVNEAALENVSDVSEHTVTDLDQSQMSDILADLLDDRPPKSSKSDALSLFSQQPQVRNTAVPGGQKDVELEEVSVASDNSLMHAISSAAAAVEDFDQQSDAADSLPASPTLSPKRKNLNAVVDNITDGLTHMIISDTMKTMGHISERQTERRINSDITKSPERHISSNNVSDDKVDRVNVKLTNGDDSHLLDMFNNKFDPQTSTIKSPPKTDTAASSMTQNLLDDAISHMLSVRKRQRDKVNQRSHSDDHHVSSSDLSSMSTPPASPVDTQFPTRTPVTPDEGRIVVNRREAEELTDDVFHNRVVLELSKQDGEVQPPRPVSPVPGESNKDFFSNEQFSTLNLMETDDIFADQEWLDDDFWTNRDGQALNDFKISAADGNNASINNNSRSELKLDLQKLTQELFYAVPHKREDVEQLVYSTVDFYWQRRRYGESWENLTPPAEYFDQEDKGHDIESNSRKVYKRLVFDLTGEILRAIYQDEEEMDVPSWTKKKFKGNKYFKEKTPPTTPERLKQVVEGHVLNIMGLDATNKMDSTTNRFRSRKKRDPVDNILVQELREEEPEWVNYDDDELAVKMQLADSIFDSLVIETASLCNDIYRKRAARNEASTEV